MRRLQFIVSLSGCADEPSRRTCLLAGSQAMPRRRNLKEPPRGSFIVFDGSGQRAAKFSWTSRVHGQGSRCDDRRGAIADSMSIPTNRVIRGVTISVRADPERAISLLLLT